MSRSEACHSLTARARHAAATRNHAGLTTLVDAYLRSKDASINTRVNYRSRLRKVLAFLDDVDADLLHPAFDLGVQHLTSLGSSGQSVETARAQATVFRTLFEALAWAKVVRFNPYFAVDIQATLRAAARTASSGHQLSARRAIR